MVKPCPNCGAMPVAEARFCRLCGAPLRPAGRGSDSGPVSPLAQTVPLREEPRGTDGLSADNPRRAAADTSRVGRAEMEDLLRRTPASKPEAAAAASDGDGAKSATDGQETVTAQAQTTALVREALSPEQQPARAPEAIAQPVVQTAQPSQHIRSRRMWQVAAIALLCVALVAGALAFLLSRRANSTDTGGASPISINDQKQLVGEKLAEAEALLSAGEFNRAIAVLREAVKLDPSNAEVRIRLGNALERTGSRSEAIAEYRAATQSNPDNATAWRTLASAQFEEKLYNDAADSYRSLVATVGPSELDDETWLAYGGAARLAGRKDEARSAYQRIVNSDSAEVAQAARRYLTELGPPAVAANAEQGREGRAADQPPARATETATPTPQPSRPAASPAAPSGNTAQSDYDAYYFQAVNIVNGRDPKTIERAELLRALALFQRAALGGTHRAEAQRYADRLGKEYDRRRKG